MTYLRGMIRHSVYTVFDFPSLSVFFISAGTPYTMDNTDVTIVKEEKEIAVKEEHIGYTEQSGIQSSHINFDCCGDTNVYDYSVHGQTIKTEPEIHNTTEHENHDKIDQERHTDFETHGIDTSAYRTVYVEIHCTDSNTNACEQGVEKSPFEVQRRDVEYRASYGKTDKQGVAVGPTVTHRFQNDNENVIQVKTLANSLSVKAKSEMHKTGDIEKQEGPDTEIHENETNTYRTVKVEVERDDGENIFDNLVKGSKETAFIGSDGFRNDYVIGEELETHKTPEFEVHRKKRNGCRTLKVIFGADGVVSIEDYDKTDEQFVENNQVVVDNHDVENLDSHDTKNEEGVENAPILTVRFPNENVNVVCLKGQINSNSKEDESAKSNYTNTLEGGSVEQFRDSCVGRYTIIKYHCTICKYDICKFIVS